MRVEAVSGLARKIEDRNITSRTQSDLDYIRNVRENLDVGNNTLLKDWYDRYSDERIREAKRSVSRLDEALHEGETIHLIKATRLDRLSKRMREYMGVNPYTRRRLVKQTLDLPYTDRLIQGNRKLSHNFRYREAATGVSTESLKTTHIYSDADDYIDEFEKGTVLKGWDRMLREIKNND